jgi:hypothetical protein
MTTIDITPYAVIVDTATGKDGTADGKVSLALIERIQKHNNNVIASNATNLSNGISTPTTATTTTQVPVLHRIQLVYTSGCMIYGDRPNEILDEEAIPTAGYWRIPIERAVIAIGGTIIRPGWVYGEQGGNYAAPW